MKQNQGNKPKHKSSGVTGVLRMPVRQRLIAELSMLSQSLSMSSSPLIPFIGDQEAVFNHRSGKQ